MSSNKAQSEDKNKQEKEIPTGWTKQWSRSQKRNFYFHENTKTSIWHFPNDDEARDPIKAKEIADGKIKQEQLEQQKRKGGSSAHHVSSSSGSNKRVSSHAASASLSSSSSSGSNKKQHLSSDNDNMADKTNVAIIVPFRDIHAEQNRSKHLLRFIPHMKQFLLKQQKLKIISDFHIYIIEQSADNRKFNRGKLLNIGYDYSKKMNANHDVFIFHDVDLLPGDDLGHWYSRFPKAPIHIARVWNRYSNNPKYFGGIVSFSASDMRRINGYPNNFWGWGGEDDEMQKRCERLRIKWDYPLKGTIEDLEKMTISQKIGFLRQHKAWKCQEKWEVLKEHETTWKTNGLSDLSYSLIKKEYLDKDKKSTKITVDVKLNGTLSSHWSNEKVALDYTASWSK